MRIFPILLLIIFLFSMGTSAQAARQQFTVQTPGGGILIERFANCEKSKCPVILILSGSKGFGASAYDEIGETFRAAGLNAYLVHVLSADDIHAIATASSASTRISYYAAHMPEWTSAVRSVATYVKTRQVGDVGVLGISLGAQIALASSIERNDIKALVLVDGGHPKRSFKSVRSLPPLLLIWGSADKVFPLIVGRELLSTAQKLGGVASLDVYEGGSHDFFLSSGTPNAQSAHQNAAKFLSSHLSR